MNKNDTIINETIDRFRKQKWHPWVRVTKIEVNGIYGTALWSGFEYLGLPFEILSEKEIKCRIKEGLALWVTSCPQGKVDKCIGDFPHPTVITSEGDAREFMKLLHHLFKLKSLCSFEDPYECIERTVLPNIEAECWALITKELSPNIEIFGLDYGDNKTGMKSLTARKAVEYCKEAEEIFQLDLKSGLRWGIPAGAEYVNKAIDAIVS